MTAQECLPKSRVMARKLRIQHPGAVYHVMNRGYRREAIFEDDEDRERLQMGSRGRLAWLLQGRGHAQPATGLDQGMVGIWQPH